jgi:hypothetical protein
MVFRREELRLWKSIVLAGTPLLFLQISAPSRQATLETDMRVVDFDHNYGVKSQLYALKSDDKTTNWLTQTDEAGTAKAVVCGASDRVFAKPDAAEHFQSQPVPCSQHAVLKVMSRSFLKQEEDRANIIVLEGNWGGAALLYNDLASRERMVGIDKAADHEQLEYGAAAKALKVPKATVHDPEQDRQVMSPDLKGAVVDYQKSLEITPDGILGYSTLEKLAGNDISNILEGKSAGGLKGKF